MFSPFISPESLEWHLGALRPNKEESFPKIAVTWRINLTNGLFSEPIIFFKNFTFKPLIFSVHLLCYKNEASSTKNLIYLIFQPDQVFIFWSIFSSAQVSFKYVSYKKNCMHLNQSLLIMLSTLHLHLHLSLNLLLCYVTTFYLNLPNLSL